MLKNSGARSSWYGQVMLEWPDEVPVAAIWAHAVDGRVNLANILGQSIRVGDNHNVGGGLADSVVASLAPEKRQRGIAVGLDHLKTMVEPVLGYQVVGSQPVRLGSP
jgi:hypothetical protein